MTNLAKFPLVFFLLSSGIIEPPSNILLASRHQFFETNLLSLGS